MNPEYVQTASSTSLTSPQKQQVSNSYFRVIGPALTAAIIFLSSTAARAQFGFVNTTDTLPLGKLELELQETSRLDKYPSGKYWLQDNAFEQEYGILDNLQVSLIEAFDYTTAYHNGPFGETTPPEQFQYYTYETGPNSHFNKWRFIGASEELTYRIQSPYINPFGLAVQQEFTYGSGLLEPEFTIMVQKDFDHDLIVLALNSTYAPELRFLPDSLNPSTTSLLEETDFNIYLGASYRFADNWFAALELLSEDEFNSYNFTKQTNGGYYLGPTIDYEGDHFFFSASAYEQMPWAVEHAETVPGGIVDGRVVDNDFERFRVRIRTGWHF